jgi:transglutaminase-like putative cysteine protease
LQVAVARDDRGALQLVETLEVTLDRNPVGARELSAAHGGRMHVVEVEVGALVVEYAATVTGVAEPIGADELELFAYLQPSRYCESDRLRAFALAEFAGLAGKALLDGVSSWVGTRLVYVAGSSLQTDGAVETLLAGRGVCRDYAHLTVALLRALEVPARVVAVYAPGLAPMDFHAVAEAHVDGAWQVVDPTLLAPRSAMLRIATGHDAAATAFLSSYGGRVELERIEVHASSRGVLPPDDLDGLVTLR